MQLLSTWYVSVLFQGCNGPVGAMVLLLRHYRVSIEGAPFPRSTTVLCVVDEFCQDARLVLRLY